MRLIFIINIIYLTVIMTIPNKYYQVWEEDVIEYYSENISPDTGTYYDEPGSYRTIGYHYVLKFFMQFNNWFFLLMAFNSLLSVWLFFVIREMIGLKVWILALLGAFTVHVPMILTDLLFAALFVTAIWQVKRLWLHFLLLGLASLIRPSLAWFFLIEPFVLYFNGYRKVLWSVPVCFVVTQFNAVRNLILYGQWTHSTVMRYNMDHSDSILNAAYKNLLEPHLTPLLDSHGMHFVSVILIGVMGLIWIRFIIRVIQRKVNWGYAIMAAYFLLPTLFVPAGARLRLPIEWILLI